MGRDAPFRREPEPIDAGEDPTRGKRLVVARIGAPHGIRGEVRVKSFTADPAAIADYGVLLAADGRAFEIEALRPAGGADPSMLVVRFAGMDDRNEAEALTGLDLSVPRERLPKADDDEFYHADLVGLRAELEDGSVLGTVIAVLNYGAGDIVEIAPARGPTILIPLTKAAVPLVDLAGGRVVVVPPIKTAGEDEGGP